MIHVKFNDKLTTNKFSLQLKFYADVVALGQISAKALDGSG